MSLSRTNRKSLNRRMYKYIRFSLTNAQVLSLNATPVIVLAAAPNMVHVIESLYIVCPAQATGATIGSATGFVLKYTNGSGAACTGSAPVVGVIDGTTQKQTFADANGTSIPVVNAPVVITMGGADVTGMTGGVYGRIYFRTIPSVF